LDLPEAVAAEAKAKGLLDPESLERLITREVAAKSTQKDFFEIAESLRALPGDPMSIEEIQAEVNAARSERAAREKRS
jgi:urease accessory protein UreF